MNDQSIIQTFGLTRYFGGKCALDQVSFMVPRGCVFAMLGRNGSGKSTLIQMLTGLIEPTRGRAEIFGVDSSKLTPAVRGRIGYVPEGHPLPGFLRVRDLHAFQKSFYSTWNDKLFRAIIDHFSLGLTQRAGQLSRGQRAGLALALAMAPQPELLVMDDPSLGLDPVARRTLLEAMILNTRGSGNTTFFTSHELADVERVADHVAILDRSALRVCCSLETLRQRVKRLVITLNGTAPAELPHIPGLLQATRHGAELSLIVANITDDARRAIAGLSPNITEAPLTLEDAAIGYLSDRRQTFSLLDAVHTDAEAT
ncbi:MAG: ABC transporter ATP-binding protein [Burkholderiales bacterium]|nr:ABC transporter ATP-binding protein [Phycisphaerae bacterium]